MIFVTGDTHGGWKDRFSNYSFPQQSKLTKDDFMIVLGDFGIWDNSPLENQMLDWLDSLSFTTLFISGNHSNYDILDDLPVSTWHEGKVQYIRPSIIHLMRGQIFNIQGLKFFTFGGASSHDIKDGILEIGDPRIKEWERDYSKLYRINHKSWWERELLRKKKCEKGKKNLLNHMNKVDYIFTHCPYTFLLKQMDGGSSLYKSDYLTDYLQEIKQTVDFRQWFFGHMYVDQNYYFERASALYYQIRRIQ